MAQKPGKHDGKIGPLLTGDRPLPSNLDAEKAVLGCLMTDPDLISEAGPRLNFEGAFHSSSHQVIFETLLKMYNNEERNLDLITLSESLKSIKKLEAVGGDTYLMELMNTIPTTANFENYVKIVHEYAVLRRLIRTSSEVAHKCYEADQPVNELVDEVQKEIMEITNLQVSSDAEFIGDRVKDAINFIIELSENKGEGAGLPTKYTDLDGMIGGLRPGDMFVLAARPSIGKTTFALNVAVNVALHSNAPVAVFSLEMNTLSLVLRLICSEAKVNIRDIRDGLLSHSKWVEVTNAADRLRKAPIYIDDNGQVDVLELRAKARRLKEKHDIQFIVIDYLQLMKGTGGAASSREQEVAQMSGGIKALAKELNIPIMILAQLNRQAEQSGQRPKLSHLRESGAIEQDADIVAILHRDREETQEKSNDDLKAGVESELIIAKHRNGETGIVPLLFFPSYTLFGNKSRIEEQDVPV